MAYGVDVFDRAVRKKDSEFHFVIRLFTDCSIDCPLPLGSILRMNAPQPLFPSRHAIFWIEAINAVPFLGQMLGVSSRYLPGPTPCMREPLRFRQVRLALLQLLFLQFQGLRSESPIHPGRQQSQPEDHKGDGGNSAAAKRGDAYGIWQVNAWRPCRCNACLQYPHPLGHFRRTLGTNPFSAGSPRPARRPKREWRQTVTAERSANGRPQESVG